MLKNIIILLSNIFFILAQLNSMGLYTGLYGGKNKKCTHIIQQVVQSYILGLFISRGSQIISNSYFFVNFLYKQNNNSK